MNCDRSENVSSYFKLEPQTQNKQIKNANGISTEQMRAGCYNLTPTIKRVENPGEACQSFYFKKGKQLF